MQVPVLATAHLRLRPYQMDDAANVFTSLTGNEAVTTHLLAPAHTSILQTQAWIAQILAHNDDPAVAYWLIDMPDTQQIVGSISLIYRAAYDMYALGFIIRPDCWGSGYATEASRAVIRYAFDTLELPALLAFHKADNPASAAVLRKIGFHYWQDILTCDAQRMPAYLCEHDTPF